MEISVLAAAALAVPVLVAAALATRHLLGTTQPEQDAVPDEPAPAGLEIASLDLAGRTYAVWDVGGTYLLDAPGSRLAAETDGLRKHLLEAIRGSGFRPVPGREDEAETFVWRISGA